MPCAQFHGLNPDEFLDDVESFENFNQFFYRKLKPSARPLAYPNDPVDPSIPPPLNACSCG